MLCKIRTIQASPSLSLSFHSYFFSLVLFLPTGIPSAVSNPPSLSTFWFLLGCYGALSLSLYLLISFRVLGRWQTTGCLDCLLKSWQSWDNCMKKRRGIGKEDGYETRAGPAFHRFFIWARCIWLGPNLSAQVEGLLWVRWKAMKSTWRGWLDKWGDFTLEGERLQLQLCLGFLCHCVFFFLEWKIILWVF